MYKYKTEGLHIPKAQALLVSSSYWQRLHREREEGERDETGEGLKRGGLQISKGQKNFRGENRRRRNVKEAITVTDHRMRIAQAHKRCSLCGKMAEAMRAEPLTIPCAACKMCIGTSSHTS
jgi:hypothetical protein